MRSERCGGGRILGELLLRLLPESESLNSGLLMSILRVCAANKAAAANLPSFWARWVETKESAAAQVSERVVK